MQPIFTTSKPKKPQKVNLEKKLLEDLQKKFPDEKIELIFVHTDAKTKKQSITVNGERIRKSWAPPVAEVKNKKHYKLLLARCTKYIKDLIWEKETSEKDK